MRSDNHLAATPATATATAPSSDSAAPSSIPATGELYSFLVAQAAFYQRLATEKDIMIMGFAVTLEELRSNVTMLHSQNDQLRTDLHAKGVEAEALRRSSESHRARSESLRARNEDLENRCRQLSEKKMALSGLVTGLRIEINELKAEIFSLSTHIHAQGRKSAFKFAGHSAVGLRTPAGSPAADENTTAAASGAGAGTECSDTLARMSPAGGL